jgi:hypothetical protein
MAKVGYSKNTAKDSLEKRQVKHQYVGSPVFEIDDPITKLIHVVGGGFFNEPRYYSTDANGKTQEGQKNPKDALGLTEQAKDVIETAKAVLDSKNPEDLLIVANWVRTDLKLRTTPCVLLAIAATSEKTKDSLRKYIPEVIQRADEVRSVFASYIHLFNRKEDGKRIKGLPHSLAKGLRDAFLKYKESDFLKYDSDDHPTFGDVALMIRERKRLPKPIFEYLVNHKVIDEKATPVFAKRLKLNGLKEFNTEVKSLAKESYATWENLISQFGSKKEVWEFLIEAGLIKYMAILRNLSNFEKVGISEKHWDKVYEVLTTQKDNKQLPFRFLAARRQVTGKNAISAVDIALDKAVENVPEITGKTFIMVDASGSMSATVSDRSKMSYKDAGYALSAILAKKVGRRAIVAVFGDSLKEVKFSAADSTMSIIQRMEKDGEEVGLSTNAYLALQWLLAEEKQTPKVTSYYSQSGYFVSPVPSKPVEVDRIVIISDMCCYGEGNVGALLQKYKMSVNKDVKFYSINMAGHGQSQADPKDKNTLLISGWSESIFTLIREFEGLKTESGKEVPSIELLRERFKIN